METVNKSGITPILDRVIVKPDVIKEETGSIYIPKQVRDKHAMAQTIGTFIAAGPDAWQHSTEYLYEVRNGEMKLTGK